MYSVTQKTRQTISEKASDYSYSIGSIKSQGEIIEESLPHLPEVANDLVDVYKPKEMDEHKARKHALKMLDQDESQIDDESQDIEDTFADINKSDDTETLKSDNEEPHTGITIDQVKNTEPQSRRSGKSMQTVDEELQTEPEISQSSDEQSLIQKGHSRKQSKVSQSKKMKKKTSLVQRKTIAIRGSVFAEELAKSDENQPGAEGIIYDEKTKIKNKLVGGGLFMEKEPTHRVNDAFQLRSQTIRPGSHHGSKKSKQSMTSSFQELQHLAHIITKPADERSQKDYDLMHEYFMRENKFLHNIRYQDKNGANGLETVHKIYRQMQMKMYENPMALCKYGEMGDQFFIVLKGTVGIMVPSVVNESYNTYFDLFLRIVSDFNNIHSYKDQHSRVIKQFIDIFSYDVLKKLTFKKSQELMLFIEEVQTQEAVIFEKYGIRFKERISDNARFLLDFNRYLKNQSRKTERDGKKAAEAQVAVNPLALRRSTMKRSGGGITSHYIKYDGSMKVKMVVMQEVAQYGSGYSFGELSLINNKPRAATVYVRSARCITAVLNKRDYLRCLGESYKRTIDEKIEKIQQFMYFKPFTRIKLRQLIYFFQEKIGDTAYVRDQYIYRQGDPVDGVYCILKGEVKRIKENWEMTGGQEGDMNTNYSYNVNDQSRGQNLGIMNEFRRRNAQQIVLSYVNNPEIIGIEEIVLKKHRRMQSMKVNTEKCEVFFIDIKDFKDKFFNSNPAFKHILCEKLELQELFHEELEKKAIEFQTKNKNDETNASENQSKLKKSQNTGINISDFPGQGANLLVDNLGQPLDSNYKSASSKIRQIAKRAAKRNMYNKVVEPQTQPIEKFDPIRAAELHQEQFPTKLRNLEAAIDKEIQRNDPNIDRLILQLRQRRNEIAKEQSNHEKNEIVKFAHLASISTTGKISEVNMVKKFSSAQIGNGDNYVSGDQLSIEALTKNLIENAESYYQMWKSERMHDEYLEKIAQNLTVDTREQKQLHEFKERLPEFEKYLMQQPKELLEKLHVPKFQKVDYDQLVKNDAPRKSRTVKKAALDTFQNQRTSRSPNSIRNEESPERQKSTQRSRSPNRGADSSRRSNGRSHTPRRTNGFNLISYFIEWMSRNNTAAMHPFARDGNSHVTKNQLSSNRQSSVSRFDQQKSEMSTMQNGFEVKRRSRSSLGGLKQPFQTVARRLPNIYQHTLPQDDTEAILDTNSARQENPTSAMNESYASKQLRTISDMQTSQRLQQRENTEEPPSPSGAFAPKIQQRDQAFEVEVDLPESPNFKQPVTTANEANIDGKEAAKNADINSNSHMFQFKIKRTRQTTGSRTEGGEQKKEKQIEENNSVTEFKEILNDEAQVRIKVTKDVKQRPISTRTDELSPIPNDDQNRNILPSSILNQHDQNYEKGEAEINRLQESIIGAPQSFNEHGIPQAASRENEEMDPNLISNLRSSISPRYSNMPSKGFSPQDHLISQQNYHSMAGIKSEVNLFDAQSKFFERQQLLSNAHRYKIDQAVVKQLKTEASHDSLTLNTRQKSSRSRFDEGNTIDSEALRTKRNFKRHKNSVGSRQPNNWVSPLQQRRDIQTLKKSASYSNGLDQINKSTSGASGFNVGYKTNPKPQKSTFQVRNALYNSNTVQGFVPTTRVIVSRPASTNDGQLMRRNMSQPSFGESFRQDNNLQPRNQMSRVQSGTTLGRAKPKNAYVTADSFQVQSAPHQNLVTAVPKNSVQVQNLQIKQQKAQASRNKPFKVAEGYEKFTDRVLQKLQLGAKVQGTYSTEQKPPILGSMSKTQQNYNSQLRSGEAPIQQISIDKNPVIIDKNNHVKVTFSHMRRGNDQL